MHSGLISFVVPSFNRAHRIERALRSVLDEPNGGEAEIIVVDDGSTDVTQTVLAPYLERGVICVRHASNLGVGPARNHGVARATGEWIVFLDSDNALLPGAFRRLQILAGGAGERTGGLFPACCDPDGHLISGDGLEGPLDFEGYIRSAHRMEERLPVLRRELLLEFPYREAPGIRRECSSVVVLNILRAGWDFQLLPDVLQEYDNRSEDRICDRKYLRLHALEMVDTYGWLLTCFGPDLRRVNRLYYLELLRKIVVYSLLAEQYLSARENWITAAREQWWHWSNWALAALAACPPALRHKIADIVL